jgi:hypothetical protein
MPYGRIWEQTWILHALQVLKLFDSDCKKEGYDSTQCVWFLFHVSKSKTNLDVN